MRATLNHPICTLNEPNIFGRWFVLFVLSMSFYPNPIFSESNWDKVMINWTDIIWMKEHGQRFFLGATGVTANKWRPSFITKKL